MRWDAKGPLRLRLGIPETLSGLLCGVLWEFWNYWAVTRWTYTVPYASDLKVFEMPVDGYLGFLPFALECFAMYHWVRGRLGAREAPAVV